MRFAALVLLPALCLVVPASAAPSISPHKARYDILDPDGKAVGVLEYSVYGNACSGYATEALTTTSPDERGLVQGRMTFESPDGKRLEFGETEEVDGKTTKDVHGTATRTDAGLDVKVIDMGNPPATTTYQGEASFPTDYDLHALSAALSGRTPLVTGHVFTGLDEDGSRAPVASTTTIVANESGDHLPKELQGLRSFRMTTRFFPSGPSESGEAKHVVESVEFENGVTSEVTERTAGSVLHMQLAALEMTSEAPCRDKGE